MLSLTVYLRNLVPWCQASITVYTCNGRSVLYDGVHSCDLSPILHVTVNISLNRYHQCTDICVYTGGNLFSARITGKRIPSHPSGLSG